MGRLKCGPPTLFLVFLSFGKTETIAIKEIKYLIYLDILARAHLGGK